jgi:hypothetical protein
MTKRIQKLVMAVAALAAFALGGAVLAQAQSSPKAAHERTTAPDRDNIQAGDQTTPDGPAKATRAHARRRHALRARSTTASRDGDMVQSGDRSTPDRTGAGSEQPGAENPEQGAGSESAPGNDGPGGHADEPGNANADHQFQGNE